MLLLWQDSTKYGEDRHFEHLIFDIDMFCGFWSRGGARIAVAFHRVFDVHDVQHFTVVDAAT